MKRLLLLLFLTVGPLGSAHAQSPADEAAVQALVDAFNQAFNAHDVRAFAATFAEDADFTNWAGQSVRGRAAIEAFHVKVLTELYKNGSQTIIDRKIRFIRPDVAAVDVRADVTGTTTPNGQPSPLRRFLLNWIVTKEANGQWLISVMHNTRLPDADVAAANPR